MYGKPWEPYEHQPVKTTASYQADALRDGVIAPILKAVFLGLTLGILAGLLTWAFGWEFSPWLAWLITWFAVMALSFWRYSERGQWLIERISGADLNGDGFVGEPLPELPAPQHIRVDVIENNGMKGSFIDLPHADKLPALAAGVLAGKPFAQETFNYLLKRPKFNELRDVMLERGLLRWKVPGVPQHGLEVTGPGRAVLKRIAETTPPLPRDGS